MSSVLMYWCHVWCMAVDVGAMSFGNGFFFRISKLEEGDSEGIYRCLEL
jgi:hypothetical protein